jgi:hypothetical protein
MCVCVEGELRSLFQYYSIFALRSIFHPLSNVLINLQNGPFDVTDAQLTTTYVDKLFQFPYDDGWQWGIGADCRTWVSSLLRVDGSRVLFQKISEGSEEELKWRGRTD